MRIVLTLTTLPERAALLQRTLASLLRQSRPADHIYLWYPVERFGTNRPLVGLPGVDVRPAPDAGPATKLLPALALEADPRTRLLVVDDDVVYPPDLVAKLAAAVQLFPDAAIGFTGWSLVEGGREGPGVVHWNEEVPAAAMFQPVRVLEGYRGILYRRDFFGPDLPAHLAALPAFRCHDDILFSGYLASRGVPLLARWYGCLPRPATIIWGLQGQGIGLHRREDWYVLGRQAVDYWSRRLAGWSAPLAGLEPSLRLQLGPGERLRPGFIWHDGQADAAGWPDPAGETGGGGAAELLLLCPGCPRDAWSPARWSRAARRLLRPGGLGKVLTPSATPAGDGAEGITWSAAMGPGWRIVSEPDVGGQAITLVAGRQGPGRGANTSW